MRDFLWSHQNHVVALLTLVARFADVGTTWLGSPRLLLEANPLARRLGWPFAVATVLLPPFLAYWRLGDAVIFMTASLLVAAKNASGIRLQNLMKREESEAETYVEWTEKGLSLPDLVLNILPSILIAPLGMMMLIAYPRGGFGHFVGLGVLLYLLSGIIHVTTAFFRFRREARRCKARGLVRSKPNCLAPLLGAAIPAETRQSTST